MSGYHYEVSKPYHGESGSLWYVMRVSDVDGSDWEVLGSYHSAAAAQYAVGVMRATDMTS